VNRFARQQLINTVERTVGLHLTAFQKLYSSFAYMARVKDLDPAVIPHLAPRLRRFARLPASAIAVLQGSLYLVTRIADWIAGVDWALYGWRFISSAPHHARSAKISLSSPCVPLRLRLSCRGTPQDVEDFLPLPRVLATRALFPALPKCTLGRCPGDFVSIGTHSLTVAPQLHQTYS